MVPSTTADIRDRHTGNAPSTDPHSSRRRNCMLFRHAPHACVCASRVPLHVPYSNIMKVGSRLTSRCAKLDASKRCGTIAEAVEASRSPAAGFRAFLPKYQALVAILRTREGSQEAMDNIAPLTAAAELVKIVIR